MRCSWTAHILRLCTRRACARAISRARSSEILTSPRAARRTVPWSRRGGTGTVADVAGAPAASRRAATGGKRLAHARRDRQRPGPERRTDGGEMPARAPAILDRERRHALLAVAGAVFHEGATQVAAGELPRPRQVGDAVTDIGGRLEQFGQAAAMAEHGRGFRPDLHEPDLADPADGIRIVGALHLHDRVGDVGREGLPLRLLPNRGQVDAAPARDGWRQADESGDGGRERKIRDIGSGGLRGRGRRGGQRGGPQSERGGSDENAQCFVPRADCDGGQFSRQEGAPPARFNSSLGGTAPSRNRRHAAASRLRCGRRRSRAPARRWRASA